MTLRPLILALPVLLTLTAAAAAQAADNVPGMRLPAGVVPQHYTVEFTVDPDRREFSGKVKIDISLQDAAPVIWLNSEELKIDSAKVTWGGIEHAVRVRQVGKDLIELRPDAAVPAGAASVSLAFNGVKAVAETEGIFRQQEGGNWYAETQFEAISARRAFPCFDEPQWKTPYQLTLVVKARDSAFANMPVAEEKPAPHGMKRVAFAETPPLPSYLLAFGVGPFDVLDGGSAGARKLPLRYITPKGRAGEARYAAAATPAIVDALERYFGVPFPYPKLDSLVVPVTVGFGAMENAGLITYAGRLIVARPEQENESFHQDYTAVAAHEIAHQWTGDLVTAAWWDDIWLNESFATWMEEKVTDELHPEWQWGVAKVRARKAAMDTDRLASTRIVRQPVNTRDELGTAFDRITYQKGGTLLNMFEQWMGEARFRDGVRRYLAAHAFEAATTQDFFAALAVDEPAVAPAFAGFVNQPGYPRVEVALRCDSSGAALQLAQRRSLPLGSKASPGGTWQVPVCVRYPAGGQTASACTLLTGAAAVFLLPQAQTCPAWVQANAGGVGYYRPLYRGDLQQRLTAALAQQTTAETVASLYDALAGAQAGDVPVAEAMQLAQATANDANRDVVAASFAVAFRSGEDLLGPGERPRQARLIEQWYGARARSLGFAPKPGENLDARLLREALVAQVADEAEDKALLEEARALALRWLDNRASLDASTARAVLHVAAARGDAALFDRMLAAARATSDRRERESLLWALGSFRDPALLEKALKLTLAREFEARDSISILHAAFDTRHRRRTALDFLETNYDALAARLPEHTPARLPSWADGFCDAAARDEIAGFFGKRMEKEEGGTRILQQTLERIDLCIAFKANQHAGISGFLAGY